MKLAIAIITIWISGFIASASAQEQVPNGPLKIYSKITEDPNGGGYGYLVVFVNTDTFAVEYEGLKQGTYALYSDSPPTIYE